jgi:hypothetical protein
MNSKLPTLRNVDLKIVHLAFIYSSIDLRSCDRLDAASGTGGATGRRSERRIASAAHSPMVSAAHGAAAQRRARLYLSIRVAVPRACCLRRSSAPTCELRACVAAA